MKGRAIGAVIAGILLSAPLLIVLVLWVRSPTGRRVEGWRFAPWLSSKEFRAQRDLLKPCQDDAQCTPPLVCFHDPRFMGGGCVASECHSDPWCAPEGVCRAVPLNEQHTAIRFCVFEGGRKEGEQCLRIAPPSFRHLACSAGLVCGLAGWCGRRCSPGQEGTCPDGFFCARGDPEGPICQPTCEGRTCPEKQECLRQKGGVSACVNVYGRDCPTDPCDDGQACAVQPLPLRMDWGSRECLVECGTPGSTGCPKDFVCHQGLCRQHCTMANPRPCNDQFCQRIDDEGNGVCLPSLEPWSETIRPRLAPIPDAGMSPRADPPGSR